MIGTSFSRPCRGSLLAFYIVHLFFARMKLKQRILKKATSVQHFKDYIRFYPLSEIKIDYAKVDIFYGDAYITSSPMTDHTAIAFFDWVFFTRFITKDDEEHRSFVSVIHKQSTYYQLDQPVLKSIGDFVDYVLAEFGDILCPNSYSLDRKYDWTYHDLVSD